MNTPSDLQQDWPIDPESDQLVQLAQRLQEAAPPLPAEALGRVEQQMHAEIERMQTRHRRWRVALGWSLAASVLLAVAGYTYFRDVETTLVKDTPGPAMIEDRVLVAFSDAGTTPTTDKPLLRLDEYRSLFAE